MCVQFITVLISDNAHKNCNNSIPAIPTYYIIICWMTFIDLLFE